MFMVLKITEHKHHRSISAMQDALNAICNGLNLTPAASLLSQEIFNQIVTAESQIHNIQPDEVHLHEIASADTLFDAIGVGAGLSYLGLLDEESHVTISDIAVGGGTIQIAHGTVPVPAPATAEILQNAGLVIVGGPIERELTTPTGAAIVAALHATQANIMPRMKLQAIGRGAGKLASEGIASPVTLYLGEVPSVQGGFETVTMLETNLDDVPGEYLGYVLELVLAEGALDAYISQVIMKKSRPGQVLHVLCNPLDAEKLTRVIISETGTLGVRHLNLDRFCISRTFRTVKIQVNGNEYEVQVKQHVGFDSTSVNFKPEFEDLRKISEIEGIPVNQLAKLVIKQYLEET
jgi:hypothetical protein